MEEDRGQGGITLGAEAVALTGTRKLQPQSPVTDPTKALRPFKNLPNPSSIFYQPCCSTPDQPGARTPQAPTHPPDFPNNRHVRQARQGSLPLGASPDTSTVACLDGDLPSQAASGLTTSSHTIGSSGFQSFSFDTPQEIHDGFGSLFNNLDQFNGPHFGLNFSDPTNLSVASPFGELSLQPILYDDQRAWTGQCFPNYTLGTEGAPATLATATSNHELGSCIATSEPLLPGRSAWKPSKQVDPLCTPPPKKRKAIALDDGERDPFHFHAKEVRHGRAQLRQDSNLACPFYKMNPKRYMSCGERSISTISALGQHLRNSHKLKALHCKECFESFDDEISLQRHREPGACIPTRGCSVDDLCGLRGKRKGAVETWYWYWEQLFPTLEPPSSPHTDGLEVVDQCMLSAIQRFIIPLELEAISKPDLILGLFSEMVRWRQHPAEPLDHARLRECGRPSGSPAGSRRDGSRRQIPAQAS